MDAQVLLGVGAVVLAGFALLDRLLDKSLSIREHEEFRKNAAREMDELRNQTRRDIDRIAMSLSGTLNRKFDFAV